MFNFEKLIVYKKAVDFSNSVYIDTSNWDKKFQFNLADQFRRAALSISLNIKGSVYECVPIITIAHKQGLITGNQQIIWYNQLSELSKMLSVLRTRL